MTPQTVLTNANLVLEDQVLHGTIVIDDGVISDIDAGAVAHGEDMDGDYVVPGLIELHTDHLEQHFAPRPGVRWPLTAAIQAHDSQIAASGITTVFDCLRLGSDEDGGFEKGEMRAMSGAIQEAQREGRLRAEHRIHLRCEVSAADVMDHFSEFEDDEAVGLISLMDHAPGQRQFQTLDQYELYYKTKRGLSDEEFRAFVERRQMQSAIYSDKHRHALAAICAARGIAIASHDDATLDHVEEAKQFNVTVAEFPTSMTAAKASHDAGMGVLMGAPNVVRGKSHSGNIAARELARAGVLDVLSSDYVPFSLVYAPFVLAEEIDHIDLPDAIAMVTANPARQVGLEDRGRLAPGLRADLVRVGRQDTIPVVRQVWREGRRVA
ncbi:alpha-D-ribose 1-methylphosphonate 5-triphosphate diphosphatase [Oceaniradius stylonematis]|uniref:alpha-D-ribose 1-methylphosphonate 5-triphosphate diphosphatase n=1 Tax=Oceaniradius stylonematis TaxID=2184161 RepID=UPI003C7BB202